MWLPLVHPLLGMWPATQACAQTGTRTCDPLVCGPALSTQSTAGLHNSQGSASLCVIFFFFPPISLCLSSLSLSLLVYFCVCVSASLCLPVLISVSFFASLYSGVSFCFRTCWGGGLGAWMASQTSSDTIQVSAWNAELRISPSGWAGNPQRRQAHPHP